MPKRRRGPVPTVRRVRPKRGETAVEQDVASTPTTPAPPTSAGRGDPTPGQSGNNENEVASMVSSFRDMLVSHVALHPECKKYAPMIKKYMRGQFNFFGIKAPPRRAVQKIFIDENVEKLQKRQTVMAFVGALWEEDERDFQGFGVDLMIRFRELILGGTEVEFQEAVGLAEHCVVTKSWWDTVDPISYSVIGYFVKQRVTLGVPLMREWIDHNYLWLRRVAILHQLCCKDKTDSDLLFSFCLKRAHETEFFIQKAIGWALRDYSRTDRKAVREFVEKHKASFSSLSVREALKHC